MMFPLACISSTTSGNSSNLTSIRFSSFSDIEWLVICPLSTPFTCKSKNPIVRFWPVLLKTEKTIADFGTSRLSAAYTVSYSTIPLYAIAIFLSSYSSVPSDIVELGRDFSLGYKIFEALSSHCKDIHSPVHRYLR